MPFGERLEVGPVSARQLTGRAAEEIELELVGEYRTESQRLGARDHRLKHRAWGKIERAAIKLEGVPHDRSGARFPLHRRERGHVRTQVDIRKTGVPPRVREVWDLLVLQVPAE